MTKLLLGAIALALWTLTVVQVMRSSAEALDESGEIDDLVSKVDDVRDALSAIDSNVDAANNALGNIESEVSSVRASVDSIAYR